MKARAYAKINLSLDVLGKREDGFHELNSVMGQVSLFDELVFERDAKVILEGGVKDDIILKAVLRLRELFDIKEGVRIIIKKNIPVAAGFGGGSADAAAALKALNELWGLGLSMEALARIGSKIGADVPFCIVGGSCFVSGKGENVERLSMPEMGVVLVSPGYEISTKKAYEELDRKGHEKGYSSLKLRDMKDVKDIAAGLHNDFIHIQKDGVRNIIKDVMDRGALGASITGKGPAVFGVFESREKALEVYEDFKDEYKFVYLGKTIK
ncbi:4-(cytidine 5'-diphospho)-2-C-methyl-D-erythritol kinase [Candidatus Woesearchaeota archaeon]|nr:4-(cytidine 5'-diphospho)-2-C-methyl-D-erythritol kinase [Candidatus Woesearchaeota archaeon]